MCIRDSSWTCWFTVKLVLCSRNIWIFVGPLLHYRDEKLYRALTFRIDNHCVKFHHNLVKIISFRATLIKFVCEGIYEASNTNSIFGEGFVLSKPSKPTGITNISSTPFFMVVFWYVEFLWNGYSGFSVKSIEIVDALGCLFSTMTIGLKNITLGTTKLRFSFTENSNQVYEYNNKVFRKNPSAVGVIQYCSTTDHSITWTLIYTKKKTFLVHFQVWRVNERCTWIFIQVTC